MSRLMRKLVVASALAAAVLGMAVVPGSVASAGTFMALGHAGKPAATVGSDTPASITSKDPCKAPFGSVQIKASAWDKGLVNTGHDGATFNVYSNYRAGGTPAACDRGWKSVDKMNLWGERYQCAELAVRVADGEWGTGNYQAWIKAG